MKWLLIAFISTALAADRSVPLSLDRAKLLVATMGINVGRIFADDENRYLLSRIESKSKGPNVFVIEVEITPLPKHLGQ